MTSPALDAVLFDMDGTLIDTEPQWMAAEARLAAEHGIPWGAAEAEALVGVDLWDGARSFIARGVPMDEDAIVARLVGEVLSAIGDDLPARPGAIELLREEAKGTISWRLKFRDGREKNFVSPIRTTPWGSIKSPAEYDAPRPTDFAKQELAHEPDSLQIPGGLPALRPDQLKQGVI